MLQKIIEFSVKNKLIIGLFIIALIGYGSYETSRLPIDAVPDITDNQVQVITVAPSLGATDIERLITFPIELANSNISGLHEIRSFSRFGLSLVTIVFNDDIDIYWARQQVTEKLQQVKEEIPQGIANISLGPVSTGLGEIYQYTVRAKKGYEKKYSAMELRTIQDWMVRRQLLGVKGVAEVSSFGGKLKQYEIAVDPNKLKANNITISDVFAALENNNQNTGGAYIEKGPTVLFIRSEGLVGTMNDIKSIFIKNTPDGKPILIGDVADVGLGNAIRYGAMCYNDEGEVSGAIVMMLKGENSSHVIKNIKERVKQIQKTLPEGVVIEPFLDRTKMVNNAIVTVSTNLIEGALIVLFVLILFLGNLRAGFLVASVIPLAMLFAVIMMNLFGVIGNLMSLGALDFGLIVDGAVFIVEAVLHQLTHSKQFSQVNLLSQKQMDEEVSAASKKMARSVVFGQIIILIVYLPTFALRGIEGKMFIPMAQTVAFALLGAFILSLTYVPMMSSLIMSKKLNHKKTISDKMMAFFERHYQNALDKALNKPRLIIISTLILFFISLFVFSKMGGEFIPALEEGDFAVETRVLTGSNISTSIESTQKAAHILKTKFPEVEQVVTKIGSGEIPTDPMPMEAADMMVILKDKEEWTSAKTFPELSDKMSKAVSDVPGITTSFQFPVQMRFNELMTGAKQDVVCKIFGENMDTLAKYAQKLAALVTGVEGTKNLYVEPVTGIPEIIIKYNREIIAQYGLNISDINNIINTGLAGQTTGMVYEGEKRFDMVVRLDTEKRNSLDDVKNLLIPLENGTQIPLRQLASVDIKEGPNQIQREDAKRRIIVGFNIHERDVQSIVNDLQKKVNDNIKFPPGYFVTYGGAFENLNAAKARLSLTVPISLILIFILLYFSFNSIKQGLLIYSAIPLSAIGGIFALAWRDMPFSISAGVGFIALFGVAVLNGIVLIAEFNRLKQEGYDDTRKIVLTGTKIRLRPVLMTGFVASLGFLPMAISNGAGAEVQRPLATVVIGGLLIATVLTLFVLPILYILFERVSGKNNKTVINKSALLVACLLMFFGNHSLKAQTPISLKVAIDSALKNNLLLKSETQKADYQKKLIKSASDIPQTNVVGEYGQINSIYTDNRIGVSQSISFPTVYSNQKKLLKEEWKVSLLQVALKEVDITKSVTQLFYTLLYLNEKEKLLFKSDSIYAAFLTKAELRFTKGESNILEKTTSENQRALIKLQLHQLTLEKEKIKIQFQLVLNTETKFEPQENKFKLEANVISNTNMLNEHPGLKIMQQQKQVRLASTKLEKSKFLPDINVGYFNMTMQGNGSDDVLYDRSKRFQSLQFGLGIPLFFGAQKAKVSVAKIGQSIAETNYLQEINQFKKQYDVLWLQYKNQLEIINYFEKTGLTNAELINSSADKQFSNGEINYLEWVLLTNQAIELRSNYIDAVKALNDNVLELNYLISTTK
jgi:cobalt-zinc-cadmium resistance protein CzcA